MSMTASKKAKTLGAQAGRSERRLIRIAIWIVVGFVLLIVAAGGIAQFLGSRLPEVHVASLTLTLDQKPEAVWALISDAAGQAAWSPGVTRVERLPDRDGHETWQQTMGRNSFVLETTESRRPSGDDAGAVTRTITDNQGPFTGSWSYELIPSGAGTKLTLTETGRVRSGIARFVMHYLMGETSYLRGHLEAIAKHFQEVVRISESS